MTVYEIALLCFVYGCLAVAGVLTFLDYLWNCMRTMEEIYRAHVIDILQELKPYGTVQQVTVLLDLVHGEKLSIYHVKDIILQLQIDGVAECVNTHIISTNPDAENHYRFTIKDTYRGPA